MRNFGYQIVATFLYHAMIFFEKCESFNCRGTVYEISYIFQGPLKQGPQFVIFRWGNTIRNKNIFIADFNKFLESKQPLLILNYGMLKLAKDKLRYFKLMFLCRIVSRWFQKLILFQDFCGFNINQFHTAEYKRKFKKVF